MNSININGLGNLNNLCSASCTNFKAAPSVTENTLPEQHDMVSLGQNMPDANDTSISFSEVKITAENTKQASEISHAPVNTVSKQNNSVDAGNGLRATMSNLGVLTMLDDPTSVASADQIKENQFSEANEMQNTLAMLNLNSMESILSEGLIALND